MCLLNGGNSAQHRRIPPFAVHSRAAPTPTKDGPRSNRDIRGVREVQLIDDTGANRGVVSFFEALKIAEDAGLDLVEICHSEPPVCKILDYGRFRFLEQKKASEARKKQRTIEIKEIKLRPGIDKHDYDVKMKAMHGFFEGDKVKVACASAVARWPTRISA